MSAEVAGSTDPEELSRPVTKNGKFMNPWEIREEENLLKVLKMVVTEPRMRNPWTTDNPNPSSSELEKLYTVTPPDLESFNRPQVGAGVRALWVGHATCLVQLGGATFLTDPVFSDRCSPFSFMGPKRYVKPAFKLDDSKLPKLDFVLISHNHYDHLDHASVMQLHKRFGDSLTWYVPLKLGAWFVSCGIKRERVVEMDWWQEERHAGTDVKITFTPSQHWSNRGTDRRATLWGGFAVAAPSGRFWFAGDTGHCPVFPQIGRRLGPFDLAAIPIGAYEPRWFMRPMHVNPEEAVRIHKDVRSRRSIGIHCCTFYLTSEPIDEPPAKLAEEARAAGLAEGEFIVLAHGGQLQTAGGSDAEPPQLLVAPGRRGT